MSWPLSTLAATNPSIIGVSSWPELVALIAKDALVDQGHEDDRPEHPETGQRAGDDRDGEGAVLEEPEGDDRMLAALLDDEEQDEHDGGHPQQAQHLGRGPRVVPGDGEGGQ